MNASISIALALLFFALLTLSGIAQAGATFVVLALVQKQQMFTAIPVTPAKAANIPN